MGEDEARDDRVGVKSLRQEAPQRSWAWTELMGMLTGRRHAELNEILAKTE